MAKVVLTSSLPRGQVDAWWADVPSGNGPADWADRLPESVRAATLDQVPPNYRDRTLWVDLPDADTVRFTVSYVTA